MAKHSFHDVRNAKKALEYGAAHGMGPFRPRPSKKQSMNEHKPQVNKEE